MARLKTRDPLQWLKALLLLTTLLSLSSLFPLFSSHFFALSPNTLHTGYLWQLFTYPLFCPLEPTFGSLLGFAFNLYLLWSLGSTLVRARGSLPFFLFYSLAALATGLLILASSPLIPWANFSGNTPLLYALLVAWIQHMAVHKTILFPLPIKPKQLLLWTLAISLFLDLASSQWTAALATLYSSLFGYLFSLCVWHLNGPFPLLHPLEQRLLRLLYRSQPPQPSFGQTKIYDFRTGRPLFNDEEFLEAMLSKISLKGRSSLSWRERWRLRSIHRSQATTKRLNRSKCK